MLDLVLRQLNNYFVQDWRDGDFVVSEGELSLPFLVSGTGGYTTLIDTQGNQYTVPFLVEGQYLRITGSLANNGVYQFINGKISGLTDETFRGRVISLAIPKELTEIVGDMEKWVKEYGAFTKNPYQSESFGGYSYTKKANSNASSVTVWTAFESELKPFRQPRQTWYVEPTKARTPTYSNRNPYPWR
jgi:hypothetical protein